MSRETDQLFALRLERSRDDLFSAFRRLYGENPQAEARLIALLRQHWDKRTTALRALDLKRDLNPEWFLSEKMLGYVFYVDRFAGNFRGVLKHLDHLEALGVTYVHFMPCLKPRPAPNDGGYSVMDYRAVNPALGTLADLAEVASALRERGITLCIDLVLNHTAKEHDWAAKARKGEKKYQAYYLMFDDQEETLAYEKSLVEIFPNDAPGNFTFYPDIGKYVWTTFNEHQWDLNWANPDVFLEIVDIMLFLANLGVDCLRLDAVAFMWKRLGTVCQNLPEVHDILQALRAATRIAAPALIHKAEAIVAPRDLVPYLGQGRHTGREANLAYHNNLMVQFWSSLAAQDARLMTHVMRQHFPESFRNASWATYIRCHDDIGWAITDEDAAAIPGISAFGHRQFLADFYAGLYPASFARGGIFQENPVTKDRRNSGSFASLVGFETATTEEEFAAARARMMLGVALMASFGGLPLLYMGDEIALTNDYGFTAVPEHAHDNRWLHRPQMQWQDWSPVQQQVFAETRRIMARRKLVPAFAASHAVRILDTGNPALFAFARLGDEGPVICVFNFTGAAHSLASAWLNAQGAERFHDLLADEPVDGSTGFVTLQPYGAVWVA
ncbi:MAG: alpha-amylase family glycosyl hydrolase [Hyphomicrobiales bacterium]